MRNAFPNTLNPIPYTLPFGGVAEWLKAAVLKTVRRKPRGFESYPLRQQDRVEGGASRVWEKAKGTRETLHAQPYTLHAAFCGEVTEWPKVLAC